MSTLNERHWSIKELAITLNVSRDTIRRRFVDEDGIVVFQKSRRGVRTYRRISIPNSVAERIYGGLLQRRQPAIHPPNFSRRSA